MILFRASLNIFYTLAALSVAGRSSRCTHGRLAASIACLTVSTACGLGKLLRQANATRLVGAGWLNGLKHNI